MGLSVGGHGAKGGCGGKKIFLLCVNSCFLNLAGTVNLSDWYCTTVF